jgi:hypothetical protein
LHQLPTAIPWDDWIPRMQRFAYWFLDRYHWHGVYPHASVRGEIAKDAVMTGILAFVEGRRHFDPDEVDLFTFLCNVVTSVIDAEARHKEHQQVHAALVPRGEKKMPGTIVDDTLLDSRTDIDRQLLAKAYVRLLKEKATPDQAAYIDVLDEHGYLSAEDAARLLKWSTRRLQSVRRSIHRRFIRLLAEVTRLPRKSI